MTTRLEGSFARIRTATLNGSALPSLFVTQNLKDDFHG